MIQSNQNPKPLSKPSTAPLVAPPPPQTRPMMMSSLVFLPLPKPDSHRSETQPWRLDSVDEEEEEVVGPPRSPPGLSFGDSDSEEEEKENHYRIPLSNEIVLKAHAKRVYVAIRQAASSSFEHLYPALKYIYEFEHRNRKFLWRK